MPFRRPPKPGIPRERGCQLDDDAVALRLVRPLCEAQILILVVRRAGITIGRFSDFKLLPEVALHLDGGALKARD